MKANKYLLLVAVAAMTTSVGATAHAETYWTDWVSEEDSGRVSTCTKWNEGAIGFGCRGPYCDEVRLLCGTLPPGITFDRRWSRWTPYISEESRSTECENNEFVTGIRCQGQYCDRISIECSRPMKFVEGRPQEVWGQRCHYEGEVLSEEQGSVNFGAHRYITRVTCEGKYCDDMGFDTCTLAAE